MSLLLAPSQLLKHHHDGETALSNAAPARKSQPRNNSLLELHLRQATVPVPPSGTSIAIARHRRAGFWYALAQHVVLIDGSHPPLLETPGSPPRRAEESPPRFRFAGVLVD
jgi:hypothetical protein